MFHDLMVPRAPSREPVPMTAVPRSPRGLKPARRAAVSGLAQSASSAPKKMLIVDLNNFASFPTLAIGLMTAALRNHGIQVEILSPLAHDVPAVERERRETILDHFARRIHLSDMLGTAGLRNLIRKARTTHRERPHPRVMREVTNALDRAPDAVLLSAYLQHFGSVREIAALAQARGIPVLLGGPMFNLGDVAEEWRSLPGISAVVGAEVDRILPDLVSALTEARDLLTFPGVVLPDGRRAAKAAPLRDLDDTPIADFHDFPWDRYPVRIVPIMTGRGCQWDKCLFCSDVISASGRTFRTRSVDSVLLEIQEQARRHNTSNFLFLDLKLNSWPGMIRGIADGIGRYVQGAEWIGTVHVDQRADNGLSRKDLHLAVEGGMRRVSFGLESGSQQLLDLMKKGSSVERNSQFILDAHSAGLSVRCTMFKGFPGETTRDMELTADFLEKHGHALDRVRFNDFTLHTGTPIWNAMQDHTAGLDRLKITSLQNQRGRALYTTLVPRDLAYRRAKARALAVVREINGRELRDSSRQFDGLM
jgi:anaerobic magnesium-protoporphyrin IX monomethyl ester cyclase